MAYDPEKYRGKREKVLGIKKRGLGFGTIAMVVSLVILMGLSIATVPQAVSYMTTRHLEDAIFKLESASAWPASLIAEINTLDGVKSTDNGRHPPRLVVTYDRRRIKIAHITAVFDRQGLTVTLLNQVNHRQHQNTLNQEEKDLETP
ncbi:hypothetical protein [Desulfobacula sp.]|uniref:hypothetical protein n=1 Tax=Desulfobacula sp. TaxID=2593537 RepID=UPI0026053647|nr:hypothetical protein [Desulfobacula sp.]